MNSKKFKAVNWNTPDNDFVNVFWEQNLKQFWIDTEYIPSKDIDSYNSLTPQMREAYIKVLAGLTLLDTIQSNIGMPYITNHIKSLQNKSILSFMGMMEGIHAKSYSTIFTTIETQENINNVFKWVENNKELQYKANKIDYYYNKLLKPKVSNYDLAMALASSVLLESFLFYSGFFLPLWLAGQGKMVASSDIIKKIIADESIHGVFVGLLFQEIFNKFDFNEKIKLKKELNNLIDNLIENEYSYIDLIYTEIGLTSEVKEYTRYNCNKALMNLGETLERFKVSGVNPIVLNGLNLETTQHDFFSKKSTNYEKALEIEHLKDEDFCFDDKEMNYDV